MGRVLNMGLIADDEIYFSRDADSRITKRDIWCIEQFVKSDKTMHIIRDHFYHVSKVMAGMFAIRKTGMQVDTMLAEWRQKTANHPDYGSDEHFLDNHVYPLFKHDCLVHSNIVGYEGEHVETIDCPQTDDFDFIGNVIDANGNPQFAYSPYITHRCITRNWVNNQHGIVVELSKMLNIQKVSYAERYALLTNMFQSHLYCKNVTGALQTLAKFRYAHVDEDIIKLSSTMRLPYKVVASFDPSRRPKDDEFVVQYGEYPHTVSCLPTESRVMYRHPVYFHLLTHDSAEYNGAWDKIEHIYILNLVERRDRYMTLLVELCRVKAPLHRVYHYKATKDATLSPYIGATKNHLDVVDRFSDTAASNCLVLEDDVVFTTDVERLWAQLKEVLNRDYDYDICFLSYSKFGELGEHDELVSISHQDCTTSSAYLLKRGTYPAVRDCLKIGYDEMLFGGSPDVYCCDRYWCRLKGRLFVFKDKLAYQRVSYSDLKHGDNFNFD
jgi:GR25 family glycosyltransferase involved in LPS biosynthesis